MGQLRAVKLRVVTSPLLALWRRNKAELVTNQRRRVAAGIVAYYPDGDLLNQILSSLRGQTDLVFLFCNSPLPPAVREHARSFTPNALLLGTEANVGLGAAYNQIIAAASAYGFEDILLFDQDSSPPASLVANLLQNIADLDRQGLRPGVIGPTPIHPDRHAYKIPYQSREAFPIHSSCRPVAFVISSGSLIRVSAYSEIGPFREDFFIDGIDLEWCFRAQAKGYSCWVSDSVRMAHRLGIGLVRIPLLNIHLVRQPPNRIYTMIRNTLAMFRLPHVTFLWKARGFATAFGHTVLQPFVTEDPRSMLRMIARAWFDGSLGRLGPP